MKKLLLLFLIFTIVITSTACVEIENPPIENSPGIINDEDFDYGNPSSWGGAEYVSKDLGLISFDAFPDDYCYDWGFSTMYDNGIYKTWWVRPSTYDAIFYAESTDLKNWTNVKRVLTLSPNTATVIKYDYIKGMMGKPSVVHVGDTYYMYFEAPASEDPDINATILEWDNNVMLATSSDGIEWNFYSDDNNQPKPVVKMPDEAMGNKIDKTYGVGQPSVFYKDGTFYLSYCYVIGDVHCIKMATSKDGYNYGNLSKHTLVKDGTNGLGVKYNSKTNKYLLLGTDYVQESTSPVEWNTSETNNKYSFTKYSEGVATFPDFVTDSYGHVNTETMYFIFTTGEASSTGDWRANHTTWDGHLVALSPCEYQNRTMTLPNGKPATQSNLIAYNNKNTKYSRPVADAIYAGDSNIVVDCKKDEIYNSASKIEIKRGVYEWGSNITSTNGEAYLAWDENYLYGYIEIFDDVVSYSNQTANMNQMYKRDSVDIFVDVPNDHTLVNEVYGLDQYMFSIGANNTDFIVKGSGEYDITDEFTNIFKRSKLTETGYVIEFKVEWYQWVADSIKENACIGIDIQINDDMGYGNREAMKTWSDHTGNSFRFIDNFGDVYLIK